MEKILEKIGLEFRRRQAAKAAQFVAIRRSTTDRHVMTKE
jgi:hypothetical protein